jgi:hypothetical protein
MLYDPCFSFDIYDHLDRQITTVSHVVLEEHIRNQSSYVVLDIFHGRRMVFGVISDYEVYRTKEGSIIIGRRLTVSRVAL